MRASRAIVTAIAAAVVTVVVAEAGARWVRYLDPVGHSYHEPRNPRFRRDWVRYTAPRPRPDGRRLVIVIGNSQGFLREEHDGGLAWPARLEARLNSGSDDVIVANWSVPAGGPSEMILLAARAAYHRPDVVIVSSGGRTFIAPFAYKKQLSFWLSDATTLAYVPSVRRLMAPEFLERTKAYEPQQALRALSALGWFRSRGLEEQRETWTWRVKKYRRVRRFPIPQPSPEAARTQLGELERALHGESPDSELLIVQMPLAPRAVRRRELRRARAMQRIAAGLFAGEARIHVADALELVPNEHFRTATHMDPDGHDRYARWLEPQVRRLLNP